jgi:hypothetical protein
MAAWIKYFKNIMEFNPPKEMLTKIEDPDQIELRNKSIYWKLKGATAKTTYSMFLKYSNATKNLNQFPSGSESEIKNFSKIFIDNYSVPLLESHLKQIINTKT